ncbi:MAG: hypothetical protein LAP21_16640 [Acidobacteriia bacterium]|nr:hypothetical protein [Terriglobia bacterium]
MRAAKAAGYRYPEQHAWKTVKKPRAKKAPEEKPPAIAKPSIEIPGRKLTVTREEVLERLWQLAALPASETKDNINGQVRAVSALAEILGMKLTRAAGLAREFEGRSSEEQEFFAVHGYWPEEPVESAQSRAAGAAFAGAKAGPTQ